MLYLKEMSLGQKQKGESSLHTHVHGLCSQAWHTPTLSVQDSWDRVARDGHVCLWPWGPSGLPQAVCPQDLLDSAGHPGADT